MFTSFGIIFGYRILHGKRNPSGMKKSALNLLVLCNQTFKILTLLTKIESAIENNFLKKVLDCQCTRHCVEAT
jgi:hypothetical protein